MKTSSIFNKVPGLLMIVLAINIIALNKCYGQVSKYIYTTTVGTYTNQVSSTSTSLVTTSWDDNALTTTLPFTFIFNGTSYANGTTLQVNSNGFIGFGTAPTVTNYTPISSTESYAGAISAIGRDLGARTATFNARWSNGSPTLTNTSGVNPPIGTILTSNTGGIPAGATVLSVNVGANTITMNMNATATNNSTRSVNYFSGIHTSVSGNIPNRKFYIQWSWTDAFNGNNQQGSNINFQIVLSETSNVIDLVYGTVTPNVTLTPGAQVGLRGTGNTDFNNLNSTSTWVSPANKGTNTNASTVALSAGVFPASGTTYTFTPCIIPNITVQPIASQTVCSGSSATFSVTAGGTSPTYQWYKGTTPISGATSATYTINSVSQADAATNYNVVITGTCGTVTSNNVTLTVRPLPLATVTSQSDLACFGVSTGQITILASGGLAPYTFSIHNGLNGDYTGSGNPYTFNSLSAGNYRVRVKDSNQCESILIP